MTMVGELGRTVTREPIAADGGRAIVTFDDAGDITRADRGFLDLFGYEPEELIGRNVTIFLPPGETIVGKAPAIRPIADGASQTIVGRRIRKDGSELWIEATCQAGRNPETGMPETIAIVTDATERRLRSMRSRARLEAVDASQAVAEFAPDGTILAANDLFLALFGYEAGGIVGRRHDAAPCGAEAMARADAAPWRELRAGQSVSGDFVRMGRDEREVVLRGTYSAVADETGAVERVVLHAIDATADRARLAEAVGELSKIQTWHAVVSFDLQGAIVDANENFLTAMGYRLDEVVGRHHRMFVDTAYAHGGAYQEFWRRLVTGHTQSGQYRRLAKGGREVWLQASYNPIEDMNGQIVRIVKYATVVTQDRLHQAEHEGQIAAIHKSQCVISFDLDGTILDANDNFLAAVGYKFAEVRGRHHRMFIEPAESARESYVHFWERLSQGQYCAGEFKRIGRDGREVWLQATYNPIFDMNGRPFKVVKYAMDVTAEKLRRADVQGQIEAIRKSQSVVTMSLDGQILEANENFLRTFGYEASEIVGHHHNVFVEAAAAQGDEHRDLWNALREGRFQSGIFKRIAKSGRNVWLQASYNPILDLNGKPFKIIKIASDISSNVAMAAAFEDAKKQALHDPATSLPNRTRLASFMASALPHPASRLAVLYIDLDKFKPINDIHGHAAGDVVLGEVADRLRRSLRSDQLVARIGGDEFVVAAPNLDDAAIETLCRRILAAVSMPIRYRGEDLEVSASIGVSTAPLDGTSPDDLLRCADLALYRSKETGGDTYNFASNETTNRISETRILCDEMRRGIEAGEFFLEFQPRFDTFSREIKSVEALVRWSNPRLGRLAPGDFIPLAESTGLIIPLGEKIMIEACKAIAALPDIAVSVNVSPIQFRQQNLVDVVMRALEQSGLPGHRLEIEITESTLLENVEQARIEIEAVKALGVKLAMDDFGTGFSSLSYLCDFPFDVIKIDRRFVSAMENHDRGRAVVRAILSLGNSLGMTVTAEGVETNMQLALLTHDRCGEVQGFLLGRPMSLDALTTLLHEAEGIREIAAGGNWVDDLTRTAGRR